MHTLPGMNYEEAKLRADILKAVAHPVRVLLVDALRAGDKCVSELMAVADIDQSTISRHLAQLKKAGIVGERREGTRVMHRLSCPCILDAFECAVEVLKSETRRRRAAIRGKRG